MSRSFSRAVALGGSVALAVVLAGCGSEDGSSSVGGGLDTVSIEGAFGKETTVEFDGRLEAKEPEIEVLKEGDGAVVERGDTALAYWWVGNGYTQQEAQDTFGGSPIAVPMSDDVLPGLIHAIQGHKVGSRVAVLAEGADAFGELGNPQIGIGNKDSALLVVDIVGSLLNGPEGKEAEPAAWAPTLVEQDGAVTSFDFKDSPAPSGDLKFTTLVEGQGAKVRKGQTIYVDYLGQVHGKKKPFDESYSKDPMPTPIGTGAVVAGWDETLVGRTVGSRLIISIPPAKGYGKAGNQGAGIKGSDTLYFVVDILGAV